VSSTLEATLDATTNTSSSARLDQGVERGTVIGRYVVLAELGAGGMGLVYAAYDPELDRKVAIKLVRSTDDKKSTTSRGHARLVREAQALARLDHPNVVTVHDVGSFGERVWIAMEFVDGQTLTAWVRAAPRSWRDVVAVLQPALRGLAAAHAAGLTHRDIKPDNIMVGRDGPHGHSTDRARSVRLMDFGLALAQADSDPPSVDDTDHGGRSSLALRVTRGGVFPGTPAYMSPEQFRGDPVDAKSDQFACCVVLWELLFG
jgi:serine/threonine protein kinase